MLYTDKTVRFTDSEINAYRAKGLDVTQITTHEQFLQLLKENARKQRRVAVISLPPVVHCCLSVRISDRRCTTSL
jgi:hypothetical protein